MEKTYQTIEERINHLKQRGLIFKNEEKAKKVILRENYFYLTEEYEDIFLDLKKKDESYVRETYFEELYAIYQFDRELRNLLLDDIGMVETYLKSYVAEVFAATYGCKNYMKVQNFKLNANSNHQFDRLYQEIRQNLKRSPKNGVVKQYQIKNKNLPPWVLVRVMTFGNIKQFYYLLKTEEKEKVAKFLGVDRKYLYTYLQILNVIRNICAHGDILFNVRLQYKLSKYDNKERERLKIRKINGDYEYGTNDMFAVILTLKKLLDQEDFIPLFLKIENRIKQVQQEIDEISFQYFLKELGFPKNYKQIKMM